jgi:hypothetical protein
MARARARAGFRGSPGSPGPVTTIEVLSKKRDGKFQKAGALTTGDFLGDARAGDLGIDTTTSKLYVCTSTATAAWQVVGAQT